MDPLGFGFNVESYNYYSSPQPTTNLQQVQPQPSATNSEAVQPQPPNAIHHKPVDPEQIAVEIAAPEQNVMVEVKDPVKKQESQKNMKEVAKKALACLATSLCCCCIALKEIDCHECCGNCCRNCCEVAEHCGGLCCAICMICK